MIPSLHIKSLPIKFTGHNDDKRKQCLKVNPSGVTHAMGVVTSSLVVCPDADIEITWFPLSFGGVENSSALTTEEVAPESTINDIFFPETIRSNTRKASYASEVK
ncbi:hypothetical protein CHARACLAT_022735 [Characodon lateralis]|uniref:Uncharacterized protein n=1 Tax=Characodon lateralis TaxID=208331 RepID=A0ABU7EDE6_9TELE|nr:hypothetical protein [Characodon lateralis]